MSTIETRRIGRFPLGRIVITRGALAELEPDDVICGLFRHSDGDWGDLCNEDDLSNDIALKKGGRLLSSYYAECGTKYWIITEHDRSVTTILLPEEY